MNPSLRQLQSLFIIVITGSPGFGKKMWMQIQKATFWVFRNGWKTTSGLLQLSVEHHKCWLTYDLALQHLIIENASFTFKKREECKVIPPQNFCHCQKGESIACAKLNIFREYCRLCVAIEDVSVALREDSEGPTKQAPRTMTGPTPASRLWWDILLFVCLFFKFNFIYLFILFILMSCSFIYIKFLWGKDNSSCCTAKESMLQRGRGLQTGITDL